MERSWSVPDRKVASVIAAAKIPTLAGEKIPSQIGEGGLWPFGEFVKG
jgi:hypothetical protein